MQGTVSLYQLHEPLLISQDKVLGCEDCKSGKMNMYKNGSACLVSDSCPAVDSFSPVVFQYS